MTNGQFDILCAGAVQGLVHALQPRFEREAGVPIRGRFGAVGAMKEALLAGTACDAMIVTEAMVAELIRERRLLAPAVPIGRVRTGIAARRDDPSPDVSTSDALRATLLAAPALYKPDAARATAGVHFVSVLRRLGIDRTLGPRLRAFPNGATAMRELTSCAEPGALGCTQITEIRYTDGVRLVGPLPDVFELATMYSAASTTASAQPALAARFIAMLSDDESRALRIEGGFELE